MESRINGRVCFASMLTLSLIWLDRGMASWRTPTVAANDTPLLTIGNSKHKNPQAAAYGNSMGEPKKREQAWSVDLQQTLFVFRIESGHASLGARRSIQDDVHDPTEKQKVPSIQRAAGDKQSYNSPLYPRTESRKPFTEQVPGHQVPGQFKQYF